MEILSYVVEGALAHEDSAGGRGVIRAGELQRMTAGRGIVHSEYNASSDESLRFLQIWLLPSARGLEPGYEQRAFPRAERRGRRRLLASPDGRDGSLRIHQDALVLGPILGAGERVDWPLADGRHAWVQVVRGALRIDGKRLEGGDGLAISAEPGLTLEGENDADILLFDLA